MTKSAELAFAGINMDQIAGKVPMDWWTGGRNVYFKAARTCRTPGDGFFANAGRLKQAKFAHFVDVGPQSYWLYGGDDGIAVTDGASHWNVTPAGWAAISSKNKKFTVGDLNGVGFVNHPEVGPFWWDGDVTHIMTTLPGWPASWSCDVMRAHKNYLFAGAIDTGAGLLEGQISWSTSADPGQVPADWVPSPTNDAGDFVFSKGGPIVDMLSVADQLLCAKSDFMGVLQYVGGQFVFEGRDVFPSTGLFATGAWVELGNRVFMITGQGKFIAHDMTSFDDLLYGVMEDYFRRQLNWEYPSSVFAWREAENGQVGFAYPVGTSKACTEAITIEAATGRPGIRDLPDVWGAGIGITVTRSESWDADGASWNSDLTTWNESASGYQPVRVVFAGGAGGMYEQGAASTQIIAGVASPMASSVERKGIDGGAFDRRKMWSLAKPRLQGQNGDVVNLRFSVKQSDDGAEELTALLPYEIGSGQEQVEFFIDGRLGGVELSSNGGSPWAFASVLPEGRQSGRW